MVNQITFALGDSNEIILQYAGDHGAKGEKRAPKQKATKEQIKKQNQINRANRVRRTIKLNFKPDDLWCTLSYPAGTKKTIDELKKNFQSFIRTMGRRYKKAGFPLKYIYRMEVGKKGGLHIHILINRIPNADQHIQASWKQGRVWYTNIYEEGGYEALADYITKKPDKQVEGQLSLFPEMERDQLIRYGSSRNLIRPEDVKTVKHFSHWTLRALCSGEKEPKPSKGFIIDKASVHIGVNPFTGMSYMKYTEYRVKKSIAEGKERARGVPWEK